MEDKHITTYATLYKEATKRANNIYLFICIASFFIFVAFFNYRISWKESEDQFSYNDVRDYWYSSDVNSKDTAMYNITFHDKYGMTQKASIEGDSYFFERFFETRKLPSNSVSNDVNDDKRMFLNMEALGVYVYVQDMTLMGGFVIFMLLLWFLFARNNEYELFKKLHDKFKDGSNKDKAAIDEILYEKLFRRVRNKSVKMHDDLFNVFLLLARWMFLFVWLLLAATFVYDLRETYAVGPDFQKYVLISAETDVGRDTTICQDGKAIPKKDTQVISLDLIPITGSRCDYLVDKAKLSPEDAALYVNDNVPLNEFLYVTTKKVEADQAMTKLFIMAVMSAIFLVLVAVQIFLIHKIWREEDGLREQLQTIRNSLTD